MRSGAKVGPIPAEPHHTRSFRILYQPPGSFEVHVHNNCLCNEYLSLRNRVLQQVPEPLDTFVDEMRNLAHRVSTWLGKHTPSDGSWVQQYTGRKATMYRNAAADLLLVPFSRRDRYVKSFLKPEKISDPTRDPRMIQARTPRFNFVLGNYLKPLEHKLYNIRGSRNLRRHLPSGRLIAKGLDLRARARLVKQKMDSIPNCVVFSIDASRFDAHVNIPLLQIEHGVYKRCYPGDKLLQQVLDLQLFNHGFTAGGIRYKCPGGRMSGDMNTALGNCLLMLLITATVMKRLGFRHHEWNMLCDGDDTLIFVPRHMAHLCRDHFAAMFNQAGMCVKLENETTRLHEIAFCQGKIVDCYDGLKFVQTPIRSMSRSLVSTRHYMHARAVDPVLHQIGQCELAVNMGVPVLQAYALAMLRNAKRAWTTKPTYTGRLQKAMREYKAHAGDVRPLPVTTEARLSFEEAFGMPLWEQLWYERLFETVTF